MDKTTFYELIQNSNSIIIAGHISPDGDAIASSFSLASVIYKKFGKKPIVLLEKVTSRFNFFTGFEFLGDISKSLDLTPDLFISLDCGSIERLGVLQDVFNRAKNTVNIDHHISNDGFAMLNFVDTNSSSTSQIVFELSNDLDVFDKEIATTIYSGIVFDTCGFKHKSTTPRTHEIAMELLKYGVDTSFVHTKVLSYNTLSKAKVLAKAIENIKIYNGFCYSFLSKDDILKECSAKFSEVEGVSSYLLDIEGVEVSAFLYEKLDGLVKVSFRSKELDVNEIASSFGGGGHKLASGATLNLSLDEAVDKVISEVKKFV